MRNPISKFAWMLALWIFVLFAFGLEFAKAEVYPVNVSHDSLGFHVTPCPLPGVFLDTWRFRNLTSDTVLVFIVMCVKEQNSNWYVLAPGDSADHSVGASDAWVRFRADGWGYLCYRSVRVGCPALSQWGTIALVGVLIGTTAFVLSKRRIRSA
ncbi:MAG: hypothetical protein WCE90_06760 [Candidatus Zixiibacteriota bacterium]